MQPRTDLYLDRARADSFGAAARVYDAHRPRCPARLIDDLLMQSPQSVLDVGAGTGIASEQLLAKGANVLAVEPDPRMADVARGNGIPIEIATFESWDPTERRFDLMVFGQSFHWVNPDIALPKAHRLLTNGGRLALMWNRLFPTHPTHRDLAEIYQDYMDPGSSVFDGSPNDLVDTERRIELADSPLRSAHTRAAPTIPRSSGLTSHSPIRTISSSPPRRLRNFGPDWLSGSVQRACRWAEIPC